MELVRWWLRSGEGNVRVPGRAADEESSDGVTTAEFVRVMIPRRLIVVGAFRIRRLSRRLCVIGLLYFLWI